MVSYSFSHLSTPALFLQGPLQPLFCVRQALRCQVTPRPSDFLICLRHNPFTVIHFPTALAQRLPQSVPDFSGGELLEVNKHVSSAQYCAKSAVTVKIAPECCSVPKSLNILLDLRAQHSALALPLLPAVNRKFLAPGNTTLIILTFLSS